MSKHAGNQRRKAATDRQAFHLTTTEPAFQLQAGADVLADRPRPRVGVTCWRIRSSPCDKHVSPSSLLESTFRNFHSQWSGIVSTTTNLSIDYSPRATSDSRWRKPSVPRPGVTTRVANFVATEKFRMFQVPCRSIAETLLHDIRISRCVAKSVNHRNWPSCAYQF